VGALRAIRNMPFYRYFPNAHVSAFSSIDLFPLILCPSGQFREDLTSWDMSGHLLWKIWKHLES